MSEGTSTLKFLRGNVCGWVCVYDRKWIKQHRHTHNHTFLCNTGLISEEDLHLHSLDAGFGSGGHGNAGTRRAQINSSEPDAQSAALLWHLFTCVCGQMSPHSPPVSPAFCEFLFIPFHSTQAQFCWLQSQHLQQQLSRQLERCVNVKTHLHAVLWFSEPKASSWLNKSVFMLSVYAVQAKEDVWSQGGKKGKDG